MTAPTREQVEEWKRAAIAYAASLPQSFRVERDVYSERLAELAFAAGQSGQPSGSGAELVREVEEASARYQVDALKASTLDYQAEGIICAFQWWPRLRAALLSRDAAREDAARLATAHESVLRSLQKQAPRFEDTDRLDAIESQSWCVGKYEANRFYVHLGQINGKQCETTGATLREAIDRARGGK